MKHTPAPWRTDASMGHEVVIAANKDVIADCAIFGLPERSAAENQANARLCAASPELANALLNLLEGAERHIFSTECKAERDAARAALKRAGINVSARTR